MSNQLEQLRELSTVVADTGDVDAIGRFRPQDATTNPSLLLKAASLPAYADVMDAALAAATAFPVMTNPGISSLLRSRGVGARPAGNTAARASPCASTRWLDGRRGSPGRLLREKPVLFVEHPSVVRGLVGVDAAHQ